jgi:PPOX class probable FMN-dependent enzyme
VRRTLLLLLLVLAAATLVLLVEAPQRRSGPESVHGPRVIRVRAGAVREIALHGGSRSLVAVRTPGGWRVDGRPATAGQEDALDALLQTLVGLRAIDAFRTDDRAALGLDPPVATIAVQTDRRTRTLLLGAPNAGGSALYAERAGHPRVFLVGTALLSAIDRVFYQRDVAPPAGGDPPRDAAASSRRGDGLSLGPPAALWGSMPSADPHRISTVDELRALVGEAGPAVEAKIGAALDEHARAFIARSPFLVLATSDGRGREDVSPKGDDPGFVAVEDDGTLLIPDRSGNRLVFGLQNILDNPHVGLLFMIPGTGETLRVSGTAELTRDPAILERLTARGKPALLAIRVRVDECFFHCAKAFLRARLWKPETWAPMRVSFGDMLAPRLSPTKQPDDQLAQAIDEMIAADYRDNL